MNDELRELLRCLAIATEKVNGMIKGDSISFAEFYGVSVDEDGWSPFSVYDVPDAYTVTDGVDEWDCDIRYISLNDIEKNARAIIGKEVNMSNVGTIVDYKGQKCYKVILPPTGAIPDYSGYYIYDIYNTEYTGDNAWKIEFKLYYRTDAHEDLGAYIPARDDYCCDNTFYIQAAPDSMYGYIITGFENTH